MEQLKRQLAALGRGRPVLYGAQGEPVVLSENGDRVEVLELMRLSELIGRAQVARRLGQQFGGNRDLYQIFGYPLEPEFEDFAVKYKRQDIAGKIVDQPAWETWKKRPRVLVDGEENENTEAFHALAKRLRLWHHFDRVDRLAGIGRYGVLLIGLRGDEDFEEPVEEGRTLKPEDILYVSPYSEGSAKIKDWVTDPGEERFGKPETYKIKLASTDDFQVKGGISNQLTVHHSRVIHVAEGLLEDEVYGRPRLERVFNLFEDLAKVTGGSAEIFWQIAAFILHADLAAEAQVKPSDLEDFEEDMMEALHGLRRLIQTQGVDLKAIGGQNVDPRGQFDVLKTLIASAAEIPQRILFGSERGELASTQDQEGWYGRIRARQEHFAEPMMLRTFVDRLASWGVLSVPEEGYDVEWPDLFEKSEEEESETAANWARAIKEYAGPGMAQLVVPVGEFRETFLGLPAEIPDRFLTELEEFIEEEGEE